MIRYIVVGASIFRVIAICSSTGWKQPAGSSLPEHVWRNEPNCNIGILDEATWRREFMGKYHLVKPVMLRGLNSSSMQAVRKSLERDALLASNLNVNLGSFYELSVKGSGSTVLPLRDYIRGSHWGNLYLFDSPRGLDMNNIWDVVPGLEKLDNEVRGTFAAPTIALGADGQGIPFHWHQASFNFLFHGRKRWAIYAPGKMTPTGFSNSESFVTWLLHRRGGKQFRAPTFECMQEPGDILYVPEGFLHATACVGDAAGLVQLAEYPRADTAYGIYRLAEMKYQHQKMPTIQKKSSEQLLS